MHYILPTNINDPGKKSMYIFLLLVVFALFLKSHVIMAQQVSKVTPAGTKFWIYTPSGYNPAGTTTYPILVVLHGGSEIGDDLTKLTSNTPHQIPSRLIYLNQWPSTLPFIVVTPQLKRDVSVPNYNDQEWPATYVDEVVNYVKSNYKVDATKMYFTGISLGGAGCWDYAFAYPSKVAALLPISGKSRPEKACLVKNIPIWAFHGESDALVKSQFSIDMVNAINKCLPVGTFKPRLSLLYAKAHEGWNEIYNGTDGYRVYDWLLKFKKNSTVNKLPYVNAGPDYKILLRTTPLTIIGDYFDSNGTISTVKWTQTAGVALTLANTTTKYLRVSNLKAGTFEFQLTVTDNQGGVSSDKVTIIIVSSATNPAVTSLILMNGKTNADVTTLSEGKVINKTTLGLTEINIRAVAGTGTGSVRLSVNSDQNTRTVNSPGPYLVTKQIAAPEWQIKNGDYLICATPYPQTGGRGIPGISQCFRITVTSSTTASTSARAESTENIIIYNEGEYLRANKEDGIQWVVNGEEIEGANSSVIRPQESGEYFVRFSEENNFLISNAISVDKTRSIDQSDKHIRVHPNPVATFLYVEGLDAEIKSNYSIYNAGGMEIQRGEISSSDTRINLPELPKGLYVIKLSSGSSNHTVKFIAE
jgi:predicted esterase